MATINIKPSDIVRGESSEDYLTDGGFSPSSRHLNLTLKRGHVSFAEAPTDRGGATLSGTIIASCVDPAVTGNDRYLVDDEGGFYTLNGATFTERQAAAANYEYQLGTTDMIPFVDGNFYFTSKTTVGQFDNDMGTITEDWWSGLDSSYRHPVEVVEKELFIGDKNLVLFYDGTTSGTAFTLPAGQNITSLRKHPNGTTLLAFTGGTADFGHTRNGTAKVYYCDPTLRGASIDGWTREVEIEAQVEGTRTVAGTVFTTWGKNFGFFDGNGLQFLKNLETSTTTYSQNITNMEDIVVYRDGLNGVAYGDLGAGRVFWKLYHNATNSSNIDHIAYKGDNVLLIAYEDGTAGNLEEVDYDNQGVTGQFLSNRIAFESKTQMNGIDIIHDVTNSAGTTSFSLSSRDTEDTDNLIETRSYVNQEAVKSEFDYTETVDFFQFKLVPSQDTLAYKLFRIKYDSTPAK